MTQRTIDHTTNLLALGLSAVAYNGYTFSPTARVRIKATNIYDNANRMVKYVRYIITVADDVMPTDDPENKSYSEANKGPALGSTRGTDFNLETIRYYLSKPGGNLSVSNRGFGNMEVTPLANTGTNPDLVFGPKPEILEWQPIAGRGGCHIVWSCEVHIAECGRDNLGNPLNTPGPINQFTYEVSWDLDEVGMTTRTVSGELEVTSFRTGTTITVSADQYRNYINLPPLPRFHRRQRYNLSPDQRRLSFTIVDTEIPSDNPYFNGVVRMNVRHHVSADLEGSGFSQWVNNLSGTIELQPGAPRNLAWLAFLWAIKGRLDAATQGKAPTKDQDSPKNDGNGNSQIVYISNLEFDEELFGRTFQFTVTYLLSCSISTIFQGTGFFQPITGSDWNTWLNNSTLFDQRGFAQLNHTPNDVILFDTCNQNNFGSTSSPQTGNTAWTLPDALRGGCPPPEQSYLYYQNDFSVISGNQTIFYKRLSTDDSNNENLPEGLPADTSGLVVATGSQGNYQARYQDRGTRDYRVVMEGSAVRAGYHVVPPRIKSIAGLTPRPGRKPDEFTERTFRNMDCTIYMGKWRIEYRLEDAPSGSILDNIQGAGIQLYI